jgi:hypothetical protein
MQKELNIPKIAQETSNWCWAACAQMTILFTNNNSLTQTQIVSVMYGVPVDRVSPKNPDCNKPATVEECEDVFTEYSVRFDFLDGYLQYNDIKTEIDAGRPMEIGIRWKNGGAHAVLIYGYETNGASIQKVLIRDPSKDTAPSVIIDYTDLITGKYGSGNNKGTWYDTLWKLRKTGT